MQYTSDTEAPPAFSFWTAISVLSGAVERKLWIDLGGFQWVMNFFILLVAPPGIATKSTTLRVGKDLLRKTGKARFGPDSVTWQALLAAFQESSYEFSHTDGLRYRQTPLSLWVSEFGNFFAADNREMIDLLVDMWDGAKATYTRRTKGEGAMELVCPWMSFLACTTPSWLQENFTAGMVGGGFASRLIMVSAPPDKHKFIAYPGISSGGLDRALEEDLVADLKRIQSLTGPMTLSPEALAWGEKWYADFHRSLAGKDHGRMGGYYARKQTHLHKIAMALSIAESDDLVLTVDHLKQAEGILNGVEKDIGRAMSNITNKLPATRNAHELLTYLQSCPVSTKTAAFHALYLSMSSRDFDNAVTDLTRAGKVQAVAQAGGVVSLRLVKT